MLRILVAGKSDKGCASFLVYAKLITLWRRGSSMLRLGLSFWKQIPQLSSSDGSMEASHTRFCHSLEERHKTLISWAPAISLLHEAPPLCQISFQMFRRTCSGDGSGISGPKETPGESQRQVPASPRIPQVFTDLTQSFLPLLNKKYFLPLKKKDA